LLFSDPEEMQVFRVDRCVRSEASIAGINWRYWGAQFGREGGLAVENAAEIGAVMSTHASILVDSVGPPSAEVCRAAASFP
jgi:hypothetical protein